MFAKEKMRPENITTDEETEVNQRIKTIGMHR